MYEQISKQCLEIKLYIASISTIIIDYWFVVKTKRKVRIMSEIIIKY